MKSHHLLYIAVFTAITAIGCHQKDQNQTSRSRPLSATIATSVQVKKNLSITTASQKSSKITPKRLIASHVIDFKPKSIDNQLVKVEDQSYIESEPITLESMYAEFAPPVQKFEVNTEEDVSIVCNQGTRIFIPKGSFEIPENDPYTTVSLQVQEFYGKEALLIGNLGTVSHDQLIESAGTIHIAAFANDKPIDLKKDKSIELGFPDKAGKEKKGMELFVGKKDTKGNIDWQSGVGQVKGYRPTGYQNNIQANNKWAYPKRTFTTFNNVLQSKYRNMLDKNFRKFKLTTNITFTIDYKGNLMSVESQGELPQEIKTALFPILESLNKWNVHDPLKMLSKNKRQKTVNTDPVTETISVKFQNRRIKIVSNTSGYNYYNSTWEQKIKRKDNYYNANNPPMDSTKTGTMEYAFSSNTLGWINCDRFINSGKPLVNVPILADTKTTQTDYKLILKEINSIMPAYMNEHEIEFINIPKGYECIVLAIQVKENKIFAGTKDIIAGEPVGKIEMKEYSKKGIRDLISQLGS